MINSINGKKNENYCDSDFSNRLEYLGDVFEEGDKWHIWCASPIEGPDGKIHLFVSRWPLETGHNGWTTHSEIAHAVADRPEGPFTFMDVILKGKDGDAWNAQAPHNPTIHKVGNKYALFYIARSKNTDPKTQRIGLLVSDSLYGPWEEVTDKPILSPSENADEWDYQSAVGVNNPAFLIHPSGEYWLYYKAKPKGARINDTTMPRKIGLAIADKLQGPYKRLSQPVASTGTEIEDPYVFIEEGKYYLITTDNLGAIKRGGGILFSSSDGIHFDKFEMGYNTAANYKGSGVELELQDLPSDQLGKFERPQILMRNGKPAYMYVASGKNFVVENGTVNYTKRGSCPSVFKINK